MRSSSIRSRSRRSRASSNIARTDCIRGRSSLSRWAETIARASARSFSRPARIFMETISSRDATKRYQRLPLCLKTASRSARSSARGLVTGYPHQKPFLSDVVCDIALSIGGVRPFGPDRSHVPPKGLGCLHRRGVSVPAILGGPVRAIPVRNLRPIPVRKCAQGVVFHVASQLANSGRIFFYIGYLTTIRDACQANEPQRHRFGNGGTF